jgi:NADH-quinone oxidoreductase subunit L
MAFDNISAWLVWILPLVASCFVPLVARKSDKARNYFVIAIAVITAALALSIVPGVFFGNGQPIGSTISWIAGSQPNSPRIDAGVYIDPLSVLFTCLVAFFGLIIAVYSWGYMKGEEGLTRYYFLILLFIGSMIGLVISDNMLQMFIFWEMVGLCSYALIAFWYKRPESINAGVKVFIMTRIGDISLLAAIGILFATFGTFSFHGTISAIQSAASAGTLNTGLMVTVAFLVLGGAIAKSAQLPLFTWLYSAMEAPTSVSALLHAATMVKAGIYLLARFILIFAAAPALIVALQPYWFPTVAWIGVLTALVGASLAFTTTDIKGVLAYSTVSQIGFMMAALGSAFTGSGSLSISSSIGWFASLFHMVSHAFFEGLGFLLAGGIIHALGTRDMRLMGGLRKAMPVTFALALIMVITTSGLPPFAAFFSKGLAITSVTDAGNLAQIILIYATTAITFAYCMRMLTLVFMGKESEHLVKQHPHEAPKVMLVPAAILAVLCIVWGVAEPLVASFMHVDLGITLLGSFMSLETPVFLALLVPTGLLVYWTYYKNSTIRSAASGSNPIATMLKHAYFFDDFYSLVVKGINKFSGGVKHVEDSANQLMSSFAAGVVVAASKLKKVPSTTVQNYIAAAVVGFILIIVLIILTVGIGV